LLKNNFISSIFKISLFLIPVMAAADMNAQITSPSADDVTIVSYPVDTNKVSVFVFHSPPGESVQGSLTASLEIDSSYNFDWYLYNLETDTFDLLIQHSLRSQSVLNNLNGGGYRVHIYNGGDTDTLFTAWLHIDKLVVSIVSDAEDKVLTTARTCDFLTLSGAVSIDTFYYYDPLSHQPVRLKNGFSFLWTSDNDKLRIPNKDRILDPNTTYSPPYLDTWYILTATDSFGLKDVDSVFYKAIRVGPDLIEDGTKWFSFQFLDRTIDPEEFIDPPNPAEGDGPLRVKFTNESINGFTYEWIFSDTASSDVFANEITVDSAYQPEFLYKVPNDYYPSLVVTSEAGCVDTFRLTDPIIVQPSLLEIPNVFSPDGDGLNDYFKVKFQSMKEFSLRIYDRAGKLVYKAEVSDMYTWDGWNGNVMNSDRKASPGTYFFVIDAVGWDSKQYNKEKQYRGVLYLFRSEF